MSTVEFTSGPMWVFGGFLFFTVWDHLLRQMIPLSARNTKVQSWKWKNTAVSLVHSTITGCWSLLCFYEYPKLGEDLIKTYTRSSHAKLCVFSW
ncbi:TLC domain-containing protein 2-like [Penaeus japonicus]|uniref:TLC domain-containing protein 2-like n=1 Tax=Penaeus japonicus TaxID=27405 RepID=UPI001C71221C|nr:TLC domain-containing protein 2-like [Penaeus japonicus]